MSAKNPFQEFTSLFSPFSKSAETSKVLDSFKKNMESIAQVQRLSLDCGQALVKCNTGLWQSWFDSLNSGINQLSQVDQPGDSVKAQMELMKQTFASMQGAMREAANIVQESNTEAVSILQQRFSDYTSEIQDAVPLKRTGTKG